MIRILHISWSLASPSEAAALPLWRIVLRTTWSLVCQNTSKRTSLRSDFTMRSITSRAARHTEFKKRVFCLIDKRLFFCGRGWGIRTPANGVRVRCATVTQIPYAVLGHVSDRTWLIILRILEKSRDNFMFFIFSPNQAYNGKRPGAVSAPAPLFAYLFVYAAR